MWVWVGCREPGKPPYHFGKDAAQAPDVHGCGVVLAAQKNLRCSVPEGHHLGNKTTAGLTREGGRERGGAIIHARAGFEDAAVFESFLLL